jgi:hypothetical protein
MCSLGPLSWTCELAQMTSEASVLQHVLFHSLRKEGDDEEAVPAEAVR